MQCAVIEFARDVCGMKDANSTEFDAETPYPVIDLMPDQEDVTEKKAAPCASVSTPANSLKDPKPGNSTAARKSYTKDIVMDTKYPTPSVRKLEKAGLSICGTSPDGRLVKKPSN